MKIRNGLSTKPVTPTLDDLLNDGRLARLFSEDSRHCALQLWILQIKSEQSTENRILYGRLLPYSYSSNCWSASDDNNFDTFGETQAQIIQLNLYLKSIHCADLLKQLSTGQNVSTISQELHLELSNQLKIRFGEIALTANNLAYRPVAYLLNRDAHDRHSPSSPHGGAGAFSASITQLDKEALFRLMGNYDVSLTASIIKHLNADTGLDFGCADTTRFGDIELLVFPALNDLGQNLLKVDWIDTPHALIARFNPMQVPQLSSFQFRLSIKNDDQIIFSKIATAACDKEGVFEHQFELNNLLEAITDTAELEVFGFRGDNSHEGTLCCRWRLGYVREIHIQTHVVGSKRSPFKFDWLEKTSRPTTSTQIQAALTRNRGDQGLVSHIGGREADPWVPINHELVSLFNRLHPSKSDGEFFQRWSQGDGKGRVQFVNWFKALLTKYARHQIVIFDPYFEDVGLGLLLLSVQSTADYIVFRSLPKCIKTDKPQHRSSDTNIGDGINNLLANCQRSSHLLNHIKLRIYGLKDGRLHDRYILIMGLDNLPVAGFNLSNSLQSAAENYPLLITPIPADTLLKVEQYKAELVQEAKILQADSETASMQLLFDSTGSPAAARHYEPLRFLEKPQAGDVLGTWVGEPLLQGLSGDRLKEQMAALALLKSTSLSLPEVAGLRNCLDRQKGNFADFASTWELIGEVLAHSSAGDRRFRELQSEHDFLAFLARFIEASFSRVYDEIKKELSVLDAHLFAKPIETLLHSSYYPDHFIHATKYTALTWAEYFAIKFLWWYTPDVLLVIAEAQMICVSVEHQDLEVMRLSLLSQIVNEIALSVQFDINETQRDLLTHSNHGVLQWLGLNVIEKQLKKPGGVTAVQQLLAAFSHEKQIQALGWMVHRAARNSEKTELYNDLVVSLHETLPKIIPAGELKYLVDSMRGHMHQLAWTGPWLFQDVIFPLLKNNRTNTDDACEIWFKELTVSLRPELNHRSLLFEREHEGQTTCIAAFLFAYSSSTQQQSCLKSMQAILKKQQRIVQQPLASTSNWTRWNDALIVSMWILTFTRWSQYYLLERNVTNHELEELLQKAQEIAMVRPIDEWRSQHTGKQGELAAFLDQVEELLEH